MPPHQAGDPVTPRRAALGLERGVHAGAAVAAPAVGMEDAADRVDQRPRLLWVRALSARRRHA